VIRYDDVRLVAALARHGSVRRTAEQLGAHLATVYRRLRELEREVGGPLFERSGGRFLPTPLAEEMAAAAGEIDRVLGSLDRRAASADHRLRGELSVTTTDSLLPLVCASLGGLRAAHPELALHVKVSNADADLARREADVAVRPTASPPDTLVGRRIGDVAYAVVAAAGRPPPDAWIGLDASLAGIPAALWLTDHAREEPVIRVNSMWAAAQAAAAGLGRAVVPTYLALSAAIAPVGSPIPALASAVWLLYHPDQRRNPRLRAFVGHVAPALRASLAGALGPAERSSP
jgi:DNA-binding transcriptional LysR family regulator